MPFVHGGGGHASALGAFSRTVWQVWVMRVTLAWVPAGGFLEL
ncbi:hypothetical protein BN1012_Phect1379 [Candidatus Phaeomarinobacter ectocarpi]|uniref:Uncharacterized protein n=1 Tax=Candidatus Phaeomarinibacter ectocarpi TaxID=1458461 RepID=X5M8G3_9HYPH|nr:hypothetical protein BN1012_Phect1379 [Candidatus Phaeomarinobacter ectocarpi]